MELIVVNLANLGELATGQNRYVQAEAYLSEAVKIARQLGRQVLLCGVLHAWGELEVKLRHWESAKAAFLEVQEIAKAGMQAYQAAALYGLAQLALAQEDMIQARTFGQASLDLFTEIGDRMASQVSTWLSKLS